ncbi:efflux RND transporter periplasmic adaptor subunit [Arenibaculum sp.]|jgi:RND family efflux transporter MFP subunit|uniref:efflux RND transporter periplasmic adaptor subunit n=1 Tax=Arenibaculum sp. TaxID=2865862 RepID=UPI002E14D565|nr:efflux RND transporter periplasmic adaptor subunit [Arenibaculum sp.]
MRIAFGRPAVLAGLGVLVLLSACEAPAEVAAGPSSPTPRPVRTAPVVLEPAVGTDRYAAVIRPRTESELGFRVAGKVVERLVAVGDRVAAGTPLARLDAADLDLRVRAAEARLAAARAEAANAREDFRRYAALRDGGWTTRQEHDRRRAAAERAEAGMRESEAELRAARNAAGYAVLTADADGIVTAAPVEPGQVVVAGQTVVRVAREGALEAVADLPEQAVAGLADRVLTVELWSLPGLSLDGAVREVAPSADPATRTYRVRIDLADTPPGVRIGMTATLLARVPDAGAVAHLPLAALTDAGGSPAVWVVDAAGTGVELRPVRVAGYEGDRVVIADGLAEGERVVTAGVHKLDPAQEIRVWQEASR